VQGGRRRIALLCNCTASYAPLPTLSKLSFDREGKVALGRGTISLAAAGAFAHPTARGEPIRSMERAPTVIFKDKEQP